MTSTETLNETLIAARAAYYSGGTPLMTDAEYDMAEQQLQANIKRHPEDAAKATVLHTVGDTVNTGGRIPHENPMRSIENLYSEEDLLKWYHGLGPGVQVSIGSKWDGVSNSLVFKKGILVKAVTRGDGEAGESILPQVREMTSIPKTLPFPIDIEVRGELVMRRSVMEQLNAELIAAGRKPYVSTRNLVAGTIKLKDLDEVAKRAIEFRPWEVLWPLLTRQDGDYSESDSAVGRLHTIAALGFEDTDEELIGSSTELCAALVERVKSLSEKAPEIGRDGLVIKVDSCTRRVEMGVGSKYANFQKAFKLQNARAESVLLGVTWQVGRQGRIVPVGEIEPVVLAGAEIRRATLNNKSWIDELGLQIGSRVEIIRSGDVIPVITGVLD
jgi:DNA ligase (NAD+)